MTDAESPHSTRGHAVYCFNSLDNLPEPVVALFTAAELRSFDLGLDWFKLLRKTTFDPQDIVKFYVVTNHLSEPILALPLRSSRDSRSLDALVNFYSSLFAPAVSQEDSTSALTECFTAIRREQPAWTSLKLQPLARDSDEYRQLMWSLRQAGWRTFEYFCFGNWYLPVTDSGYETFIETLSSRVRHTLKRKGRILSNLGRLRLTIVFGGGELDKAIEDYTQVYAASWKKPEPYPAFMQNFIRLCAARGWLRLGLSYIDGDVAAAQFWIVNNGRAAIYKLAHDARFDRYSVGTLLTNHLMQHVMDVDRVREIDYLIGDDSYKRDWMSHRRERWGLLACNPRTLTGLGLAAEQVVSNQAKRLCERLRLLSVHSGLR